MSERAICGATNRAGGTCRAVPMSNGRCKNHGGLTPAGIASPHFQHGRYSRVIPRVAARLAAAAADPNYLELRQEIALVDARLGELLGRLDDGEHGGLWTTVLSRWAAYTLAQGTAAEAEMREKLACAITTGADDWKAWDAVRDLVHDRRKLVAGEVKRILVSQKHLSVDEAHTLAARMVEAVRRHVHDDAILHAISREFESLTRATRP